MERWLKLLKAHDTVLHDRQWDPGVRIDTCQCLIRKMLELGPLEPLPIPEETTGDYPPALATLGTSEKST